MSEKLSIKESLEVLAAVELGAISILDIAKDGIGLDDLPKALELVKKADVFVSAVKDVKDIPAELKDLDQAEMLQLGMAAFELIKKVVAATKKEEK